MKFYLLASILGCLFYISHCLSLYDSPDWKSYKAQFVKSFENSSQEKVSYQTWRNNKIIIDKHNAKFAQGKVSYKMAVNKFTDMTTEQRKAYKGFKVPKPSETFVRRVIYKPTVSIADVKDWRDEGAVTGVKDQGQCGSCYSFSVTGAIEGQRYLATNDLIPLSEQQIVDCDAAEWGCGGGFMENVYEYVIEAGGLESEEDYPYLADDGQECAFDEDKAVTTISGYDVIDDNEDALLNAVATVGPISVGIYVADSFYSYSSGVYDEPNCIGQIDHAVLVVGYGTENGQDYWMVKNSWNTNWGDNGYIKMARNQDNLCYIASYATVPTGAGPARSTQKKMAKTQSLTKYFMQLVIGTAR